MAFTTGEGFTVMVKVVARPGQLFAVAITLIVAITAELPLFMAVNAAIFPLPLVPKPMFAELVQLNVAPIGLLLKLIADPASLLQ